MSAFDFYSEERAWVELKLPSGGQKLDLIAVPRAPFGGKRWFFVCPQTGKLVQRMYRPRSAPIFGSRHAHGLSFLSERNPRFEHEVERAFKLYHRMTDQRPPEGATSNPPPRKPGSHKRRYAAQREAYEDSSIKVLEMIVNRLGIDIWRDHDSHADKISRLIDNL